MLHLEMLEFTATIRSTTKGYQLTIFNGYHETLFIRVYPTEADAITALYNHSEYGNSAYNTPWTRVIRFSDHAVKHNGYNEIDVCSLLNDISRRF